MTTTLQTLEWRFGGFLQHGSPVLGWSLLALLFALGAASVWISYRKPRAPLNLTQRILLCSLRGLVFAGLALMLANPTRVSREMLPPPPKKPLAVLVDQSGSMTAQDNRGRSRLQDALQTWKRIEPSAREMFGVLDYFSFATQLTSAGSLKGVLEHKEPEDETRLNFCLADALRHNGDYAALVCITDGLDTTSAPFDEAIKRSQATRTPIYFLPCHNRLQAKPLLAIREINAPSETMQRTEIPFNAVVDCYTPAARDIPLTLHAGTGVVASGTLHAEAGFGSYPWRTSVTAQAPGLVDLQLTVGNPGEKKEAHALVRVTDRKSINLLVYQGTLDWGFRFLSDAIARDPSFHMTGLFDSSTRVRILTGGTDAGGLTDLPSSRSALGKYNIIVVANADVAQLDPEQQEALLAYVRDGGGVLFIESDTHLATRFSGSTLEQMLPVWFCPPEPRNLHGEAEARFMNMMGPSRGNGAETRFAAVAEQRDTQPRLAKFQIVDTAALAPVLSAPGKPGIALQPMFTSYARVESAKPGARILAVHPTETNPSTGAPSILMASQQFGKGRSTVLTTDSLWRWKLSLPSGSREAETFWQQLLVWLAQPSLNAIHFVKPKVEVPVNRPVRFVLEGNADLPAVTVQSGTSQPSAPLPVSRAADGTFEVKWTPIATGPATLTGFDSSGAETSIAVAVVESQATLETSNIPPDLDLLRNVAESTGGELIQNGIPTSWRRLAEAPRSIVVSENLTLLWNRWPLLLACLGLYSVELLLRRRWNLI